MSDTPSVQVGWKAILRRCVGPVRTYFDSMLRGMGTDDTHLFDEELGQRASCCTTGQAACLYTLDAILTGGDGKEIAVDLMKDVERRQLPSGGFSQPYYRKAGEKEVVDIAEIGAVANSLYHVWRHTGSDIPAIILKRSADYLITQKVPLHSGAVYKNPNAVDDVLNGDIYAAHTWARAFQVTRDSSYAEEAKKTLHHVGNAFSRHESGWWPYTETWAGEIAMGNSVSYQATIIAFAHTCLEVMPAEVTTRWMHIINEATGTIARCLSEPPSEFVEVPWWSRDWKNTWEIYLALWRSRTSKGPSDIVNQRMREVVQDLEHDGVLCFSPKILSEDRTRTPVSTTFRKTATFAGILSYMALDEGVVQGADVL
ncbi:hypothetical protein [Alicyclobacillus sp. SO9]|uniref:hypothetical protein n=1 Tax=Alicyclobacillus sp. SO9 TaxID=2665646 RepID=UPI0018E829D3|nr:hypothetical protein [Alicyclobacillus sp. SO9]QQE80557.1 hypothetical protein GI364_09180 [Alicyclobacillus sp. SO9]